MTDPRVAPSPTGRHAAGHGTGGAGADVSGPEHAGPAHGRPVMTVTTAVSIGAAVAGAVGAAAVGVVTDGAGVPAAAQVAVAVAGIVLGIPHGAVDHIVALRLAPRATRGPLTTMIVVLASYLMVAAVAAVALLVAPDVAVAVFLLVAAAHFAWGELAFAADRRGRAVAGFGETAVAVVVVGLVVIGLPLASAQGRAALAPLAPGLTAALDAGIGWLPGPSTTVAPGGPSLPVVILLMIVTAGLGLATAAWRRGLTREVGEVVTLMVLFIIAPPLMAFGIYFGAWHAVRHTRRLVDLLAPCADRRVRLFAFARAATAPTIGAVGVLTALWIVRAHSDVVVTGISLLLALTFPHVAVVAAFDRSRTISRCVLPRV